MSTPTIKDLASELGVSPSTISRALSDHPDISEEMKEKVRELAKRLNYTKNLRASALRTKTSNVIALIVPEINMFFMPELIYGVNVEAEKNGLSVMILQTNNSLEKEKKLLLQLHLGKIDFSDEEHKILLKVDEVLLVDKITKEKEVMTI